MRYLVVIVSLIYVFSFQVSAEEAAETEAQSPSFEPITQDIGARLDRLEQFLSNSALLDMLDVLESLKLEVNELRGKIEVQTYNLEQLQKKQRDLYTDIDGRLQRLESNRPVGDAPVAEAEAVVEEAESADDTAANAVEEVAAAPAALDPVKAQAEYQRAFKLLKESRYEQALAAFKKFLQDFPDSDYSDNAQYWLGETNYVMQEYELAINEYQALLNTYPDSQKVSHALLKIGYSYAELGNAGDAEKTLNEVKKMYPGTTAARLASERLRKLLSNKESNT